jgi:hypothetical protein
MLAHLLFPGFLLAIKELHHGHAGNVFLQKCVDARNRRANLAIGIAHIFPEHQRDHQNEGQHGHGVQRELYVDCDIDHGAGYGNTLNWVPGMNPGLEIDIVGGITSRTRCAS